MTWTHPIGRKNRCFTPRMVRVSGQSRPPHYTSDMKPQSGRGSRPDPSLDPTDSQPGPARRAPIRSAGRPAAGAAPDTTRQDDAERAPKRAKQAPSLKGKGDQATRQRVIEAAIRCILEQGFYRASSNAIADRAGLSWGVIQYYFGSRESLMLAVLEEGTRRLIDDLSSADLTGQTLNERIEQYITIVERYYADPEYLAFIQVLLNLSHDPRTSAQTRETMTSITATVDAQLDRLGKMVIAGRTAHDRELRGAVFQAIRGFALSEVMLGTLPYDTRSQARHFPTQRRHLTDALTLLIEKETATRPDTGESKPAGARKPRTE
jgi:AcrR family transcriptional regulator